jgi:hypothetical protein
MSRKASTRKNAKRGTATKWIPKTIKASKRIGRSTVKQVRFLLNRTKQALVKLPGRVDRAAAKTLRSYSSRRHRR